jgi:hypothetical protein
MQGAALGMPDEHVTGKAVGNHLGRDIARIGAALLVVAVLCANRKRGAVGNCGGDIDQGRGRTDERVDGVRELRLQAFGNGLELG